MKERERKDGWKKGREKKLKERTVEERKERTRDMKEVKQAEMRGMMDGRKKDGQIFFFSSPVG